MANYRIELGFDTEARQLMLNGRSLYYLPAGITKQETNGEFVLSTYTELRLGDTIAMRIFDLVGSSSVFRNMSLKFEMARNGMTANSPFRGDIETRKFSGRILDQTSVIFPTFGQAEEFDAVDIYLGMRSISERGSFVAVYELEVEVNGMTRTYRHDPEWIIEPF